MASYPGFRKPLTRVVDAAGASFDDDTVLADGTVLPAATVEEGQIVIVNNDGTTGTTRKYVALQTGGVNTWSQTSP